MSVRVMLSRPRTGAWLDRDAPVRSKPVTTVLSGPGDISITLPIEYLTRTGEDGHPVLLEYGTAITIVEGPDRITAHGLVDQITPGVDDVQVSAGGVSMTAKDTPWGGPDRAWIRYDALSAWRHIWGHIRTQATAMPVELTGDTACGVLVGRPESARYREVRLRLEAARASLAVLEAREAEAERMMVAAARSLYLVANKKKIGKISSSTSVPTGTGEADEVVLHIDGTTRGNVLQAYFWVRVRPGVMGWGTFSQTQARDRGDRYRDWEKARDGAREQAKPHEETISELETYIRESLPDSHAEPYTLAWHTDRDLSANLTELAGIGGFEWVETATWSQGRVVPQIQVGKRIGVRRGHMVFEVGTNVQTEPSRDWAEHVSEVAVFGAGEGADTLRADRAADDGVRVRRVRTVTDKDAKTRERLHAALNRESASLSSTGVQVSELTVTDHPFAPVGTWGVGDELPLRGRLADGAVIPAGTWCRVLEMTYETPDQINVKVEARWD